ncbi:LURA1 protein, partial [Atractosteus spatula]|nr:LURA1 protein [Atractosteus spatula]
MDEASVSESLPDLKDLEIKIGRKTPDGLLRWMREDSTLHLADGKFSTSESMDRESGKKGLAEKIRDLKLEMAYLRSIDVKILQQLVAVHEGIEAVKWILEDKSNLTSRCSSLTSSQYSLVESQDTSWRGSWNSLQDPNDKLDNISIGSYLDTLADEMDEYCPSSSESVICATPLVPGGPLTMETQWDVGQTGGPSSPQFRTQRPKEEQPWTKAVLERPKAAEFRRAATTTDPVHLQQRAVGNSNPDKQNTQDRQADGLEQPGANSTRSCLAEKLSKSSPKLKPYKNGKIDLEGYKLNSKIHMEYDAHWRWVQSQDDVTFL